MKYNACQQDNNSNSVPLPNETTSNNARNGLLKTCRHYKTPLDSTTTSCTGCTLLNNSKSMAETTTPAKRGYKSHVPSACINCKTAHLACDVSRPCQRCITLNKTDTCQDMQHKKRGRPKLREKKVYSTNEHNYEILYGTIQTPTITMKNPTRNIIPNNQVPPFKAKLATISKRPSVISFIHEPIESFQSNSESSPLTTNTPITNSVIEYQHIATSSSIPLAFDYSTTVAPSNNTNLLLESVLPTIQLSQEQQQHIFFDYNNTTPILLNNNSGNSPTLSKSDNNNQVDIDHYLTIIMSMEVCCAKVSDDTIKYWGYYPQELAHRSFYDFISPKDSDRLARLHRLLLDNSMNIVKSKSPLPPTERTTSSLFSATDNQQLSIIANGSRSFSDSIHIKKRSGEYELYKVVVFIGGGLGADLYDISSFSKQYIVAQFRKHEYEVAPRTPSSLSQNQQQSTPLIYATLPSGDLSSSTNPESSSSTYYNNIQPIAVFSPMSPLSPPSPTNSSLLNFSSSSVSNSSVSSSSVDMFRDNLHSNNSHSSLLFRHNNSNSLSTTTKFSQMSIIPPSSPPKFNIAPITTVAPFNIHQQQKSSLFRRFPASVSSAASGPNSSSVAASLPSSVRLRSTDNAMVTHPTQQYFLATSSSTLNAAASAAQGKTRLSISGPTNNDNTSTTNRKMEMSIRSLLC